MTPPNPRGDSGVISGSTLNPSYLAHPVLTQAYKFINYPPVRPVMGIQLKYMNDKVCLISP